MSRRIDVTGISHPGIANRVEWIRPGLLPDEYDITGALTTLRYGQLVSTRVPPPLAVPAGDVRTSRPGWCAPVSGDALLWPSSPGADDLIRLFDTYGVRALVEHPDAWWRWWDTRWPWD